jgi:anti-anti-sigma factor
MKTNIKKDGDTLVVSMDGKLDFETTGALKEDLGKLIRQSRNENKTDSAPKRIIFNMENLDFVGSSGISSFVQTLKDFNSHSPTKPRYCSVKSEFQKVIKAFDETDGFEFFENEDRAKKSFDQ